MVTAGRVRWLRPGVVGGIVLALPLLGPAAAAGQEVHGTVVAAGTGAPIGGARVTIASEATGVADIVEQTLPDGRFRIALREAGRIRVHVEQFGYRGWGSDVLEVGPGEAVTVAVELETRPIEIEGIDVGVTSRGDEWGRRQFERRRAANEDSRVTFLDPIHIALADARHPIDFLRGAQGMIVEHDDQLRALVGRCVYVFLDHIRPPVAVFNANKPDIMAFGGINDLGRIVARRDIRAIEVYPSRAALPDELRDDYRRTRCALVQIWTSIGW